MEILIDDIPEEGLEINATESDAWFLPLIRDTLGNAFEKGDKGKLYVSLSRFGDNVNLDGVLELTMHPDCDRCLAHYKETLKVPLHAVLAPLHEQGRNREYEEAMEDDLVKKDLEFEFYEGDRFDLAEIVREQMLLAIPMKHLCKEDCLGLCQHCGKNLNEGRCKCAPKKADPRWAALGKIKVKKNRRDM